METFEDRLLELVEQHPVLYDVNCLDYKKNNVRQGTWHYIAKQLGSTSKVCQMKWKNIRYRYIKDIKENKPPTKKRNYSRDLSFLDKFAIYSSQDKTNSASLEDEDDALEFVDISKSNIFENITIESSNELPSASPTIKKTKNNEEEILQSIQNTVNSVIEKRDMDSVDMYLLSYGDSLRAMGRHEQDRVKFEIARIFKDAKYKE